MLCSFSWKSLGLNNTYIVADIINIYEDDNKHILMSVSVHHDTSGSARTLDEPKCQT